MDNKFTFSINRMKFSTESPKTMTQYLSLIKFLASNGVHSTILEKLIDEFRLNYYGN